MKSELAAHCALQRAQHARSPGQRRGGFQLDLLVDPGQLPGLGDDGLAGAQMGLEHRHSGAPDIEFHA